MGGQFTSPVEVVLLICTVRVDLTVVYITYVTVLGVRLYSVDVFLTYMSSACSCSVGVWPVSL